MVIEKNDKEILIRLEPDFNTDGLQEFIEYLNFRELKSQSKINKQQLEELSNEVKSNWWSQNKSKYIE